MNVSTQEILATAHANGSKHDYTLFKEKDPRCNPDVWYVADLGYQGLATRHLRTCLPIKKPIGKELTCEDKAHNRAVGRFRVVVEHAIRTLKIWRILKETYRNRRKRFALRFHLIAGLANANLRAGLSQEV